MNAAGIFNSSLADVSRLAVENGLAVGIQPGRFYHAPCHDSLDGSGEALLARLGHPSIVVPHCCGEAGTLALSRPDIAAAMGLRKGDAFQAAFAGVDGEKIVLTNCPSCLSGLARNQSLGFRARHLAEELAICVDGKDWLARSRGWRERAEVVTF
jgi:Fe-S oxidoreductase